MARFILQPKPFPGMPKNQRGFSRRGAVAGKAIDDFIFRGLPSKRGFGICNTLQAHIADFRRQAVSQSRFRLAAGDIAVSYTHLDVYKRQG